MAGVRKSKVIGSRLDPDLALGDANSYACAMLERLGNKEKRAGCTVHYVNKKLDSGNSIVQKSFFIKENDKVSNLKEKTQRLEYKAFPEAIIKIFRNKTNS